MRFPLIAIAAGALALAPAFAADLPQAPQAMTLAEAVAFMQSHYPGEVIAVELDATGDKSPHYHVDLRFPHGSTAKLEVDAVTRRIASRQPSGELAPGAMTLRQAVDYVTTRVDGNVMLAELDASDARSPHYHVDLRMADGRTARFKLDPGTRHVGFRHPAMHDE